MEPKGVNSFSSAFPTSQVIYISNVRPLSLSVCFFILWSLIQMNISDSPVTVIWGMEKVE